MHRYKFLLAFVIPPAAIFGFNHDGWQSMVSLILIFFFFPLIELFLPLDTANFDQKMAEDEKNTVYYDSLLFLSIPVYLLTFAYFLLVIPTISFGSIEYYSAVFSMGIICAIFGFNIGHELSHRTKQPISYFLGHFLLLSILNLHFIPYHNAGHHRNVGKPNDPSTAVKGEWLYTFWFRSQIGGYFQAWQIENQRMKHLGHSKFSFRNNMVKYTLITIIFLTGLYFGLGQYLFLTYILAVLVSVCLLETINYIEHYGLIRKRTASGIYEPVQHHHSWNSDHFFGRALLFNLSRHSDHHYNGSIKYQVLKSLPDTPQMPFGYPTMVVLAFFPPIWFYVMNKRLDRVLEQNK